MGPNGCDLYHELFPGEVCAMHQPSCVALGLLGFFAYGAEGSLRRAGV